MLISILCLSALASLFCPLSLPVQAACLPKTVPGSSSGSDESRPPGFTLIFPLLKFILGWSEKYVWCGLLASKSFFSSFSLFSVFFFFQTVSFLPLVQKKLPACANQPYLTATLKSDKRDGLQTSSLFIWLPDSEETWLPSLICLQGFITFLLLFLCLFFFKYIF